MRATLVLAAILAAGLPRVLDAQTRLGPGGSPSGSPYTDTCAPPLEVGAIVVRAGFWVDGVQLWCRQQGGSIASRLPLRGGSGGSEYLFELMPEEYITGLSGTAVGPDGPVIYSLAFRTNQRQSPTFGNGGTNRGSQRFNFDVPPGNVMLGIHGHASDFLNSIGLLVGVAAPTGPMAVRMVGMLNPGMPAGGNLSPGDVRVGGRPAQGWSLMCHAGQTLTVDMTSTFDNYLYLWDANNGTQLGANDDANGTNARITYQCPDNIALKVGASSFSSSFGGGPYQIAASFGGGMPQPMAMPQAIPQPQPMPMQPMAMSPTQRIMGSMAIGTQVSGNLSAADPQYNGKPFQSWALFCQAGQAFTMNIMAGWDNYGLVFDPSGNVVARDDDSGGSGNARVNYTCAVTGQHALTVTTYSTGTSPGPYTLNVIGSAMPAPVTMSPYMSAGLYTTTNPGYTTQGTLVGSPYSADGKPFQAIGFQCVPGQRVTLTVSASWDNYLLVLDPAGNIVARDDDSAGSLNARATVQCGMQGMYRAVVTTYRQGMTGGPFALVVQ